MIKTKKVNKNKIKKLRGGAITALRTFVPGLKKQISSKLKANALATRGYKALGNEAIHGESVVNNSKLRRLLRGMFQINPFLKKKQNQSILVNSQYKINTLANPAKSLKRFSKFHPDSII